MGSTSGCEFSALSALLCTARDAALVQMITLLVTQQQQLQAGASPPPSAAFEPDSHEQAVRQRLMESAMELVQLWSARGGTCPGTACSSPPDAAPLTPLASAVVLPSTPATDGPVGPFCIVRRPPAAGRSRDGRVSPSALSVRRMARARTHRAVQGLARFVGSAVQMIAAESCVRDCRALMQHLSARRSLLAAGRASDRATLAVSMLQAACRSRLAFRASARDAAVGLLQDACRSRLAFRASTRDAAVVLLQSYARRMLARQRACRQRAVVILQARARGICSRHRVCVIDGLADVYVVDGRESWRASRPDLAAFIDGDPYTRSVMRSPARVARPPLSRFGTPVVQMPPQIYSHVRMSRRDRQLWETGGTSTADGRALVWHRLQVGQC